MTRHYSVGLSTIIMTSIIFGLSSCTFVIGGFSSPFVFTSWGEHRRKAEQLETENNLEAAIDQYLLHIEQRRGDSSRPESENPSFYYILIADLYIRLERPKEALSYILRAKEDGVMKEFVIDRMRQVSAYHENAGAFSVAIQLLTEYRSLDPLLFDWDIDRLHKKLVQSDQTQGAT
jgi:hypothetical protein